MKTVEEHQNIIIKALKTARRWQPGLMPQVYALASALRSLDIANLDLDTLETSVVQSPQGLRPHPVFHIRKEAEDSVTRSMKSLGLTAEALIAEIDEDPMEDLTRKVMTARSNPKVTKMVN